MTRAYLDPLREELHHLRTENARLRNRNAALTDTLTRRSEALNRTGQQNDKLRATAAACPTCRHSLEPTP